MEEIWRKVCLHYEIPEEVGNAWYVRIVMQLNSTNPARAYHNWQEMILRKQEFLQPCQPSIVLGALFQYYHFDGNRSCVQENCAVFEEFCRDAMFEDEEDKILVLYLIGKKNIDAELKLCYDDEASLLQDIDLAILGSPAEIYKHYTHLMRLEHEHLNEDSYRVMRLKVLETLLLIPAIYGTAEYYGKYETTARDNIKNEIAELKQQ